jgi:RNA polymerase sigma factor (sigma-70 family)
MGGAPTLTFEEAFDDCYRVAYRAAFRLLGSRGDAEDAAQEAMTRAYTRWRRIEGFAEAWVARVATNVAIDATRKQKRAAVSGSAEPFADDRRENRIDLANALARLPRRQRDVVALRFLADRTEEDVARALGISIGAVKQHGHRGLEALRNSISLVVA